MRYNYGMMEEVYSLEQSGGKASTRAKNKYRDKTYDRVEITLPKGRKAELQAHAQARGESLNGFIGRAIDETVERDKSIPAASEGKCAGAAEQGKEAGE